MNIRISKPLKRFQRMSVKKKMYTGFGAVLVVLSLVLLQTLLGLSSVSDATRNVLEKHQPVMITALRLSEKVKESLSSLGFYLISQEDIDKQRYEQQLDEVSKLIDALRKEDIFKTNIDVRERISHIEDLLQILAEEQAIMIVVSKDPLRNYPAVRYAEININPLSQATLQNLQQILNSEEEYGKRMRMDIIKSTNKMRYTWARIMSELRAFLGFRTQTNYQSLLTLLEDYNNETNRLDKLFTGRYTFEQEEAIANIKSLQTNFREELKHTADILNDSAWRQDAHIYRTRTRKYIGELNNEIDLLINNLVESTKQQGDELSLQADAITLRIVGMLSIGIIAVLALAQLLAHGIIRPMSNAVDSGIKTINKAVSSLSGDDSQAIRHGDGDEISEMEITFDVMSNTLSNAIQRQQDYTTQLQQHVDTILGAVNRAAAGDLTGNLSDFTGSETTDELAHGVQAMINSLNQLVSQVQQSGIQVTSSATEIAATANQQQATVTEQAASTQQIMATATEISATSQELASTMHEVASIADQTAHAAAEGQTSLASMEATMHQMNIATASITSKLAVLSEKAANINTVVTTITKVADQTNLLSLNAAIEAEKAGEYGLGFSVVATEIRRLADQTAVATWDIEQMVKEMQSAVSAGVMGMDKFSEEVGRGVEDVRQISGQLAHIIDQVQTLTPSFETVNEGMQSQTLGAQQISEGMVQLNQAAQQTVESLRQSSHSIETLKDAAHDLQQGVTRFKTARDS
ncbi:methyl-accepting chemotaxis protein [Sulfuriflexus mobilis]|uniref:methyl-accepting chemotaxis protein n=1 Tax=Sulfuriflexus mobilis TaxID=1811807 RepID=UPI0022B2AAAE|nr:methyl-accepting chemotaxis protein [Sulfuriflexus mobilis]